MGLLKLNMFDVFDHSFFSQNKSSYSLDVMKLQCLVNSPKGEETWESVSFLWSYDTLTNNDSISLQAVFLSDRVQDYLKDKDKALCRLIFYEDGLLRYFSGEMRFKTR